MKLLKLAAPETHVNSGSGWSRRCRDRSRTADHYAPPSTAIYASAKVPP